MKEAHASSIRKKVAPRSSSASPKRLIGVAARIFSVRAVGVPSGLYSKAWFCAVTRNPGAIALTRMPSLEKWTASHLVKFAILDEDVPPVDDADALPVIAVAVELAQHDVFGEFGSGLGGAETVAAGVEQIHVFHPDVVSAEDPEAVPGFGKGVVPGIWIRIGAQVDAMIQ